jgi:hypothetical protein
MSEKRKKKRKNEGGSIFSPNVFLIQTNVEQGTTGHTQHSTAEALVTIAACTMHKSTPQSK